jgi:hypothetical protein
MHLHAKVAGAAIAALACAGAAAAQSGSISVGALPDLDAWSVSGLARGETPYPRGVWARADPIALAAALDRIAAQQPYSPAGQGIARRLLASPAGAPQGAALDLAGQRFAALGRLGAADALARMIPAAPDAAGSPAIAQFAAQAELARGRVNEACARIARAQGEPQPPFAARVRAYCFASAGETAAADLALEVARSAKAADSWFIAALPALTGAAKAPPPARYDTSLNASISLAAKLRPGANPLAGSSALAALTVAGSSAATPMTQAEAAFIALRAGALPREEARRIIFAAAQRQSEIDATTKLAPAPRAATPARQPFAPWRVLPQLDPLPPVERASRIQQQLRAAPTYADFAAAAQLFRDDLVTLPRIRETGPLAGTFARAALAFGDPQLAFAWRGLAEGSTATAIALARLDAALAAAKETGPEAAGFAVQRRIEAGGPSALRDAAILIAIGAPGTAPAPAAQPGLAAIDAGQLGALASAAARGARGEALTIALGALGAHAGRWDAASLSAILKPLVALGLIEEARAIAVEALIADLAA